MGAPDSIGAPWGCFGAWTGPLWRPFEPWVATRRSMGAVYEVVSFGRGYVYCNDLSDAGECLVKKNSVGLGKLSIISLQLRKRLTGSINRD